VAEWDFKSYVLGTMFYRYISENFTAYINEGEHAAGNQDFDYYSVNPKSLLWGIDASAYFLHHRW